MSAQQQVQKLRRHIADRGFKGLEYYIMDSESDGRVRYEVYVSDGYDNYSTGEYLGRVVFDATHDDPMALEPQQ